MCSRNPDLMQQTNQVGVRFLLAEVDAGLTFLTIAATTAMPVNRDRYVKSAHEAYSLVQRLLPRAQPAGGDEQELVTKMAELRTRLIDAGCALDG